ncbi:MAG: hypothetical protein ACREQ4_10215 [Candidatus Binataceae bacterium]
MLFILASTSLQEKHRRERIIEGTALAAGRAVWQNRRVADYWPARVVDRALQLTRGG